MTTWPLTPDAGTLRIVPSVLSADFGLLGGGGRRGCVEGRLATHRLMDAHGVPGFNGFAVGRTLWLDALQSKLASRATRAETVTAIADSYLAMIDGYRR
jgi:hypothetical protein